MDHNDLEYFWTSKKLNQRQARWSLYLSWFDFTLHHHLGKTMGKMDGLSWRRLDPGSGASDNSDIILLQPELFTIQALEGLTSEGEEHDIFQDIWCSLQDGDPEEPVTWAVTELQKGNSRSVQSSEWSKLQGLPHFWGKIYVPKDMDLQRCIVSQHYDTQISGNAGRWKILELVARNYWWPQMSRYIGQYVKTCDLYLRMKTWRQPPMGELVPLPIPEHHWDTISLNFIVELPESSEYDAVMNVVDSFSKRTHLISTNTIITALRAAQFYLWHIWKHYGLLKQVVSDWGLQFVTEFTWELYR